MNFRERHLDICTRADPAYGAGVAKALASISDQVDDLRRERFVRFAGASRTIGRPPNQHILAWREPDTASG